MTAPRIAPSGLVEYSLAVPPLAIEFELSPESVTRTRTWHLDEKTSQALQATPFRSPADTVAVTQGAVPSAETLSFTLLLDATDRLNAGDPVASRLGVQPELDVLASMAQPKVHGPKGVQVLAGLGLGGRRGFAREETLSVLLFVWCEKVQAVLMTSLQIEEQAHLPSLFPYRARATIQLQVIESDNPFQVANAARQMAFAALLQAGNAARLLQKAAGGG